MPVGLEQSDPLILNTQIPPFMNMNKTKSYLNLEKIVAVKCNILLSLLKLLFLTVCDVKKIFQITNVLAVTSTYISKIVMMQHNLVNHF